jgi:hypothetical protein
MRKPEKNIEDLLVLHKGYTFEFLWTLRNFS